MSKIIELRNKRNTLWEQTKAFLEEHRDANGLVEASAVEQYNKMASDVKALGDEIAREAVFLVMTQARSLLFSCLEEGGMTHGYSRKKAHAYRDQRTGRQSGQEKTE